MHGVQEEHTTMRTLTQLLAVAAFALIAPACGQSTTASTQGTIMSCFQGSTALTCVATPSGPETTARDVDGDGKDDDFVCADRDTDDDGLPDFEDDHDDRGTDDPATHDANDDHGGAAGTDDPTTHDVGDDHGDDDNDGVPNGVDCSQR
jgi:hypothetical protein